MSRVDSMNKQLVEQQNTPVVQFVVSLNGTLLFAAEAMRDVLFTFISRGVCVVYQSGDENIFPM